MCILCGDSDDVVVCWTAPVERFYALIDRRIRRRLSALDQMDFVKDLERVLVMFKVRHWGRCDDSQQFVVVVVVVVVSLRST